MNKRTIKFSPPDVSEREVAQVAEALRSGWITTGPKVKKLEKLLAGYVGVSDVVPNCVCLNSQTACGEMSLRLLGIGAGDEVITCAYTYTASASVIVHVGAKVVLVDCQKDSLEMNYDALETAITDRTKAIIPIDIAGIPCDYKRIFEIVERKKGFFQPTNRIQKALGRVAVLADAAHALGAKMKMDDGWKSIGAMADFTNFSFHAVKNFTTAEGGAMTWRSIPGVDDAEIYHQLQLFSLHGQSKDALAKTQLGAWEYDIVGPWYKCNMTDIMAGMGLAQFERYPQMLERRREIIERYDAAFRPLGVESLPHYTADHQSSGHLYISRVFKKNGEPITDQQRREIIVKMAELGVATNVHYKPLPMHTAYKNLGFSIENYPNSYARYSNEITLPLHTCLSDEDVDYVIECYCNVLKEYV